MAISRLRARLNAGLEAHAQRGKFWKSLSPSSLALFYAGVFCLFATVGVLALTTKPGGPRVWEIAAYVVTCGGFAVLIAIAAVTQRYIFIPLIVAANLVATLWLAHMGRSHGVPASPPPGIQALALTGNLTLALGYAFFMFFFNREGARYFRAHTEIALARELHQALVPEVQRKIGSYEIYGASVPSGEVGGDLVDLVEHGDEWTAYVADVSGHGVSPGVLMAMFKATVRSRIQAGCDGAGMLEGIHQTLYPLKTSNMFVTAGFLQARGGRLTLSLAGHPALLHFHRCTKQIAEYDSGDLPLGILPEQHFTARVIDCQPGDILLLLTDGVSEVADKNGEELGVEPIKAGLRKWADLPLPELFHNIRELALHFGKQEDDQTVLLVRKS